MASVASVSSPAVAASTATAASEVKECKYYHSDGSGDSAVPSLEHVDKLDTATLMKLAPFLLPPEMKDRPESEQLEYLLASVDKKARREQMKKAMKASPSDLFAPMSCSNARQPVEAYRAHHAQLLDLRQWAFTESFTRAMADPTPQNLRAILTEPFPGIFAFDMFSPALCEMMMAEVDRIESWSRTTSSHIDRPNSMNRYGVILDQYGFSAVFADLTRQYMEPLSRLLFSFVHDTTHGPCLRAPAATDPPRVNTLDEHHAFIVEYQRGKDLDLDFHVDESEMTLNVCLGREFTGGHLHFGGVRCMNHQYTPASKDEQLVFQHRVGQAIVHLGKHRHAAGPIISGHRMNLILWCRSRGYRNTGSGQGDCPDWCGYPAAAAAIERAARATPVTTTTTTTTPPAAATAASSAPAATTTPATDAITISAAAATPVAV